MPDRQSLRRDIRARRRLIGPGNARKSALQLTAHARHHPWLLNSRHVAGFLPADGEMDPLPLMQHLWSLGKRIYLPVLTPFNSNHLWFARFEPGDELVYNRFGIPEPARRQLISATALDLVLTPLVAFDLHGHRLGMGGGFYDRSFSFLLRRTHWQKPRLMGVAYEFQQLPSITPDSWDVPLDAVATETLLHLIRN